ncbi:MAG: nicotinate (nicotinamide) nucleotide adenylyltransferase [Bacteroidetes bacterium]|nr:nicotinate (nicotinamide) nucleotide adenylyltransferase [Bacteroidota bacterium]
MKTTPHPNVASQQPRVGLYFGSFNPVHLGHLVIANHMLQRAGLDEVWLVVTPTSPHKQSVDMLPEEDRLQMVRLALADHPRLMASDVEFGLPRPNFTADTMSHLRACFPNTTFSLIMGEDNVRGLSTWRRYEELLTNHRILVYPRHGTGHLVSEAASMLGATTFDETSPDSGETPWMNHPNIERQEAPMIAISSTYIRDSITAGHDVQFLLPDPVVAYIGNNHFYEQE